MPYQTNGVNFQAPGFNPYQTNGVNYQVPGFNPYYTPYTFPTNAPQVQPQQGYSAPTPQFVPTPIHGWNLPGRCGEAGKVLLPSSYVILVLGSTFIFKCWPATKTLKLVYIISPCYKEGTCLVPTPLVSLTLRQ